MLDTSKIIQYPLHKGQFFEDQHVKTQIYLHHTSGNSNPFFSIDGWNNNIDKIGTAYVIAGKSKGNNKYKDGDILQCFDERFWAYHLGVKSETFKKYGLPYQTLDKNSIGVELCSWGFVEKQSNATFKNYIGGIVPNEEVIELVKEFRGYKYWHSYTEAQINSLRDLLVYLCNTYNISKNYNEGMWDVNPGCLNGANGIWNHVSSRADKTDVYPHPYLVSMLKNLNNKTDMRINTNHV